MMQFIKNHILLTVSVGVALVLLGIIVLVFASTPKNNIDTTVSKKEVTVEKADTNYSALLTNQKIITIAQKTFVEKGDMKIIDHTVYSNNWSMVSVEYTDIELPYTFYLYIYCDVDGCKGYNDIDDVEPELSPPQKLKDDAPESVY